MFWSWLYTEGHALFAPVNKYLHRHSSMGFRTLLFGGDLLFLIIFLYMQQFLPHQHSYGLWLAGFTATLVVLFVLTMGSARLNGYRLYQDIWIRLAIAIMLLLCLILVLGTLF
jgi:hypothetical protein